MSCPTGFEKTLNNNCRIQCPPDFKYVQDLPREKCVYKQNNAIVVIPTLLPVDASSRAFQTERNRVREEVTRKLQDNELFVMRSVNGIRGVQSSKLQTEYTEFKALENATKRIQELNKKLRVPKTTESDTEKDRKAILSLTEPKLLLVQVVLALVIASLISYLVLPINAAHGLTFLLLSVGIAVGIFLKE